MPLHRILHAKALRATGLALAASALTACSVPEVLEVNDPDIVNPEQVASPAGATAVKNGALARLAAATSGDESLLLLGGLFADEWINGDSFIDRWNIDQRAVVYNNAFLTTAYRVLHRARSSAEQAIPLLQQYIPTGPKADVAEMYFVMAYAENLMAEAFCSGLVFSNTLTQEYGSQITTAETYALALAHADSGLALITGTTATDIRVRNALAVTRARILLNQGKANFGAAATAVAQVPTGYRYNVFHSVNTSSNQFWAFNISARRYSVSNNEGGNGLPFASASDPRLPTCAGGTAGCPVTQSVRDDQGTPMNVQRIWVDRYNPVDIVSGTEARLIEAEALLNANNAAGALAKLNELRTTNPGLAPLTDAGTAEARVTQLYRERAYWRFGRGTRLGDLRRLVREYGRSATAVFPSGAWHKSGSYGPDVNFPIPQAEENNPNVTSKGGMCLDRSG
jgi:starch-binding outer membrane protein, SusD/RagB family